MGYAAIIFDANTGHRLANGSVDEVKDNAFRVRSEPVLTVNEKYWFEVMNNGTLHEFQAECLSTAHDEEKPEFIAMFRVSSEGFVLDLH